MALPEKDVQLLEGTVFINHIDTFIGEHLSRYLANCIVGATKQEGGGEGEGGAQPKNSGELKNYTVFGTVKKKNYLLPDYISKVLYPTDRQEYIEVVLQCPVVIFDVSSDPNQIDDAMDLFRSMVDFLKTRAPVNPRTFILLSTALTWNLSKPADPDDPEIPLTEEDFRRRKSHMRYTRILDGEKEITNIRKTIPNFKTIIVASGIPYGKEECTLHPFFRAAWMNAPYLPIYGEGKNIIPLIHIDDLLSILQNISDNSPITKYFLAVDGVSTTLESVVKILSKVFGSGKTKRLPEVEAFKERELNQIQIDQLQLNCLMSPGIVKDIMPFKWVCEDGFVASINKLAAEFRNTRNINPIRVCILGPPGVGKTTIAKDIAYTYQLHYLGIKELIDDTLISLKDVIADSAPRQVDDDEEEDEEEVDEEKLAEARELLKTIEETLAKEEPDNRLDDETLVQMFRRKMLSNACLNQGYVLDGFPKTIKQAEAIFGTSSGGDEEEEEEAEEEEEKEAGEDEGGKFNKKLMPHFIILVDAEDDFLKDMIRCLPEDLVIGTHNMEVPFVARLEKYRTMNNIYDTVINYFDELEILPVKFKVDNDKTVPDVAREIKGMIGMPVLYGLTERELAERERRRLAEEDEMLRRLREMQWRRKREEAEIRRYRQQNWTAQVDRALREEEEQLAAQSMPIRNYMMEHIMPILAKGVMEVVQVRPDDPVDYLAEFLFKENPGLSPPTFKSQQ